ncbi:MAG: hypothetical protein IJV41_11990 [Oscillospiraceae bacterium]|nr:hypothetical protein [Oscillospiraceae bacterium]
MNYVIGILAGVVWGGLGALLNNLLLKKTVAGGNTQRVFAVFLTRTVLDVAFLAVIVLARHLLPFSYEMALVGTAGTLGLSSTWLAFRHAAGEPKKKDDKTEE